MATDSKFIRYDSEAGKALSNVERDNMFGLQMVDLTDLPKEEYLTKWYGPVGSPERDAEDERDRKDRAERYARAGNVDLSESDSIIEQVREIRQRALQQESELLQQYIGGIVKYQRGTVLAVEPQPKKRSLYYCGAERFLVLGYQPLPIGNSRLEPTQLWVDIVGLYLDKKGRPVQPTTSGQPRRNQGDKYQQEHIALNSSVSHLILGIASDQSHTVAL